MPDFYRLPAFVQSAMGGATFRSHEGVQTVYLTFDDGPHPFSTPGLLDTMEKAEVKATFFCLGKQVALYPDVYKLIRDKGHSTGNHGYNHLDGFKTSTGRYIADITEAAEIIDSNLFRPPYGRITPRQAKNIAADYRIIFWDLLYADYRKDFNPGKAFNKSKRHITPGSILVLHDRPETFSETNYLLTLILDYLKEKGLTSAMLIDEKEAE